MNTNKLSARDRRIMLGLCSLLLHNARANLRCFVVPAALRPYINAAVLTLLGGAVTSERTMRATTLDGLTPQILAMAMLGAPVAPPSAPMVSRPVKVKSETILSAGAEFVTSTKRRYKVHGSFNLSEYQNASAREKSRIVSKATQSGVLEKIAA